MQGNSLENPNPNDGRSYPMEDSGGAWRSDRPPDGIPTIPVSPARERHGSPVASKIQRIPKKSMNTEDGLEFSLDQESMDFESNEMEQVGGGVSAKTVEGIDGASEQQRVKASYASMVSRKARADKNVEDGGLPEEDEVVETELRGIYSGLVVTWEEGYRKLIVETDCKDTINLIYSREGTHASLSLVLHIQALLRRDWCVVIQYVPRSLNSLADGLAKLAVPDSLALVRF
ncbi:hypothetical protein V6N13_101035 [Hibiscus sabdariffa]